MIALAGAMMRAGGWPRTLLVAACTAATSGLLLVAVAMLRLPQSPQEHLDPLVAETGNRAGTAFGVVLLTVPVLLLLYQAVRLGLAARERRFGALRVAGATPAEVRRLGALEVGIPSLAGGLLGVGVYALFRALLGGDPLDSISLREIQQGYSTGLTELVPVSVAPSWWQFAVVVTGIAAMGAFLGWRTSRRVALTPWGVARGAPERPPRPWGVLALAASPLPVAWAVANPYPVPAGAMGEWSPPVASALPWIAAAALAVLGIASLSSWTAYRVGRAVARHARSAATLLAARRLVAGPRAPGRAAAAIGGIALATGGLVGFSVESVRGHAPAASLVGTYIGTTAVVMLPTLAVVASLAVRGVESVLDRRRVVAALSASGVPLSVLGRAQCREAAMVAVPTALCGVVLGVLATSAFILADGSDPRAVRARLAVLISVVTTAVLVWVAVLVATGLVRPWLRRAADPEHLRTE